MTKEERDNVIHRELKIITALDVIDNTMREIRAQLMYLTDEVCQATRKDEPNSSEKPNNCDDLQDWKDRMWAEAIVTEPTISKMEQVDEPQTCSFSDCDNFKNPDYARCIECKRKQIMLKDEPQTERSE